jgi:2-succinyl-5-enolpyruvyl-6-hydroxy-3-cyclohexene-1-carboxylate synthase
MYSNKDNINILTSLLLAHGVHHAVVCPGSRNAPIVSNLSACSAISCFPVTDERSAGFYALGLCQAVSMPVALCVTSGTALLNLLPSVAEAYYRHIPLVVISADRPERWIDQLDGQTLPQSDALGRFVGRSVNLPEPKNDEERWHCNRLVNEALIECRRNCGCPVHINVPISEPLFEYTAEKLPAERKISFLSAQSSHVDEELLVRFSKAEKPMIVIGQTARHYLPASLMQSIDELGYAVMQERLSGGGITAQFLDEAVYAVGDDAAYLPDFILYAGDTLVSKRMRRFLRKAVPSECWEINVEGRLHDVFMNLTGVIQAEPKHVLEKLKAHDGTSYRDLWNGKKQLAESHRDAYVPEYSQMLAVKTFEEMLSSIEKAPDVHYANSTAVRLGNIFAQHYIYCNRGVNGIDGSLSAAAGFSLLSRGNVYCVIGDLSFFYDQNALWNRNLKGNFRILLLNNGCGGIFHNVKGAAGSIGFDNNVAGKHSTSAEGICIENNITYFSVHNEEELNIRIRELFAAEASRPVVVEVFTDAGKDNKVFCDYYNRLK